jgi:microcystin-dependent protein
MAVKFVSPLGLPVAANDQSAPGLAQIYFNSTTKKVKVYKSTGWAEIGGSAAGSSGKPGMVTSWVNGSAPSGWLLCNGNAVSRTTYADLFAVIGTNYGVGNGTTTFNLPNYQDNYWLIGAPSSLSTAPDHNGLPGSWRVASGSPLYAAFGHSTNGAHSSHATSMTTAGYHNHAANHTHVVTAATSGSATEGTHTVGGLFNSAGAAHTHSITSGANSASGGVKLVGSTVSGDGHTHVISLASGGTTSNHDVGGTSFTGTVSHLAHTHASGTGTSDDASAMGINAAHSHTMSALASAGEHAHANHQVKIHMFHYIIKT